MSIAKRKVLVKSGQVEGVYTHVTEARTFGELKKELEKSDVKFNFSGQRVVVNPGMVDLRQDDAVLPIGEFALFLIPEKQKAGLNSGSMGYQELKAAIKDVISKDGQTAKEHFGNYTILGTESLRDLYESYEAEENGATDAGVEQAVKDLTQGVELINKAASALQSAVGSLQKLASSGVKVPEVFGGYTLEELNTMYSGLVASTTRK